MSVSPINWSCVSASPGDYLWWCLVIAKPTLRLVVLFASTTCTVSALQGSSCRKVAGAVICVAQDACMHPVRLGSAIDTFAFSGASCVTTGDDPLC